MSRRTLATTAIICLSVALVGCRSAGWATTSVRPPERFDLPTLEAKVAGLSPPANRGYAFAAFGDQRALADGEWQELMLRLGDLARTEDRLLFMIDTGDMVKDGRHTDQFWRLREVLRSTGPLPYLVGIGNHEVHNNQTDRARANTASFLGYLDDRLAPDRLYYVKTVPPVRFVFLDTNDLVYGDHGDGRSFQRGAAQLQWLTAELARQDDSVRTTAVIMHHPFVLSSTKHHGQAVKLWNERHAAGRLPEILADGRVDVVLTGHTHTYERFRLRREGDGAPMHVINISGRPRGFFRGSRQAQVITGREREVLEDRGWQALADWSIQQEDAMSAEQAANQFVVFSVEPDGGLLMDVYFLDATAPNGLRASPSVRLK